MIKTAHLDLEPIHPSKEGAVFVFKSVTMAEIILHKYNLNREGL